MQQDLSLCPSSFSWSLPLVPLENSPPKHGLSYVPSFEGVQGSVLEFRSGILRHFGPLLNSGRENVASEIDFESLFSRFRSSAAPVVLRLACTNNGRELSVVTFPHDQLSAPADRFFVLCREQGFRLATLWCMPMWKQGDSLPGFWAELSRQSAVPQSPELHRPVFPETLVRLLLSAADLRVEHGQYLGLMLAANPPLKHLDVSHNPLGGAGVLQIAQGLSHNTNLLSLNLADLKSEGFGMARKCRKEYAEAIGQFFKIGPMHLKTLDVSGNRLKSDMVCLFLAKWLLLNPALETLKFGEKNLRSVWRALCVAWKAGNSNLRHFDASDCIFMPKDPADDFVSPFQCLLPMSPQSIPLKKLLLVYLSGTGFADLLCTMPKLSSLTLRMCSDTPKADILTAVAESKLEELVLVEGDWDSQALSKLFRQSRTLKSFRMECCVGPFATMDMHLVDGMARSTVLESLTLEDCGVEIEVLKALCDALPSSLRHLNLSENRSMGSTSGFLVDMNWIIRYFAEWIVQSRLVTLNVAACGFDKNTAFVLLENLCKSKTLESLHLDDNDIGDAAVAHYVLNGLSAAHCRLSTLTVTRTNLTIAGVRPLAQALRQPGCPLLTLHVGGNRATQVSAPDTTKVLLSALERNGRLMDLSFDMNASDQESRIWLHRLLERNRRSRDRARDAALCLIACRRFGPKEFPLRSLHLSTMVTIAKMVWSTRHEAEWLDMMMAISGPTFKRARK